jgi:DNA modification methylase
VPEYSLFLGDCLEILPTLENGSVDAILTDVPYGTTACKWDVIIPLEPMWKEVKRVLKKHGVFVTTASQPFTSTLIASHLDWFRYELIWHKTRNSHPFFANIRPLPQHENVLVFSENKHTYNPQKLLAEKPYKVNINTSGRTSGEKDGRQWKGESKTANARFPNSVFQISNPSRESGLHPTQKPVALYEYLVKTYTNESDTVLDFCMGSGTTGVAALPLGRKFIGIEKDPKYFAIAAQRIQDAVKEIEYA